MSYYEGPSWQGPGRQAPWEQSSPSRSGASSTQPREETNAFVGQFEEVERAVDNLNKSGKMFPAMGRRDPNVMPGMGRGYNEFPGSFRGGGGGRGGSFGSQPMDPRMGGPRHHSMEFDPMRQHSGSNLQNFYANQRFQPRGGENDQMQQAKRRMAAQRERELRNYHQEQQYNRNAMTDASGQGKPEGADTANINEDDHRDHLQRQQRGMYGNEGFGFGENGQTPRPLNQQGPPSAGRNASPMAFNNFGAQEATSATSGPTSGASAEDGGKGPSPKPTGPRSRSNSNSSPASANNPQNFALFETTANAQQSSRTSTSSPGGSPPRSGKGTTAPAPIGTRPINPNLNKRATPPAASPLSFGFAGNESNAQGERAGSAASNPPGNGKEGNSNSSGGGAGTGNTGGGAWGTGSGVWGQGKLGGVQASVWS